MTRLSDLDAYYDAVLKRIAKRANMRETGCLEMSGHRGRAGHVRILVLGWRQMASRAAWMAYHRQLVPEGLVVRHTCDNGCCVATGHLLIGTQLENMQDAVDRQRFKTRRLDEACTKGHPRTADNLVIRSDGKRDCRICAQTRNSRSRPGRYRAGKDARERAARNLKPGHVYVATSVEQAS